MTPEFDRNAVEPGVKSLVSVEVDTSAQSGSQEFELTVVTEPPSAGGVLRFRVTVPSIGRFEPVSLDWPMNSEPDPRTVTFIMSDFPNVTFRDITFDGHLIHAEVLKKSDRRVELVAYPLSTERPFQATIYANAGVGAVHKVSRYIVTVGGLTAAAGIGAGSRMSSLRTIGAGCN